MANHPPAGPDNAERASLLATSIEVSPSPTGDETTAVTLPSSVGPHEVGLLEVVAERFVDAGPEPHRAGDE